MVFVHLFVHFGERSAQRTLNSCEIALHLTSRFHST
jgi:hypothetical protein